MHMSDRKVKPNQQPTVMETAFAEPTEENERSLEQRLWNISQASSGGRIRGYINKCELTDDDTIRVHTRLPNAEMHTQTFPVPKTNSPEYAFVRLIEDCGYSLASAGRLAGGNDIDGARVWCEPIDVPECTTDSEPHNEPQADTDQSRNDDWRLVIPEYTPSLRERLRARLNTLDSWRVITTLAVGGGLLLLPLIFPVILLRLLNDDSSDVIIALLLGTLALLAWSSGMWLLYTAVLAPAVDMSAVI
jgi:hypothetical protein